MKIEFNKVTKLSRTIAIVILVGLPFWGFYVGYEYGLVQVPTTPPLSYTLSNLEPTMSYPTASGTIAYAPFEPKTYQTSFYSKGQGPLYTYSFSYPRDFDLVQSGGVYGGFLGDGRDAQVTVTTPSDAFQSPKSNFGSAYFTVSVASGTKAAADCYKMPAGPTGSPSATSTIEVNGRSYMMSTTTGVGAGNIYDSRVYRTTFNGFCFEAALTVHTGNIGMYTPGTVVPFDGNRAFDILEAVLNTFRVSTSTAS